MRLPLSASGANAGFDKGARQVRQAGLKPGYLVHEDRKQEISIARAHVLIAENRVRRLNDELADACTAVKVAKGRLRKLQPTK